MAHETPSSDPQNPAWTFILAGLLLVAAFHLLAMALGQSPDFSGNNWYVNWDTDSYSRVLRVLQLHQSGIWYDTAAPYFNAPFGIDMHWTRPLDVLLYAGGWVGSFFTDFKTATEVWGMVAVGPLFHMAFVVLLYWAVRPATTLVWFALLVAMFLSLSEVSRIHLAGFIDFHGIQVMVLLALLVLLVKRLDGGPSLTRHALVMGVIGGFGVWISVESLMLVLPALLAMALLWVADGDDWLDDLARFSFGFGATLAVALVVERPPADWLTVEFDRISIVHLLVALALSVVTWVLQHLDGREILASWHHRALVGVGVMAIAAFGLLVLFPPLLGHPQQSLGPIADLVLDAQSGEMPFFIAEIEALTVVSRLGPLLFALPFSLWCVVACSGAVRRRHGVYLIFMVCMTGYLVFFGRAITFAQIAYLLPWFDAVRAIYAKLRSGSGGGLGSARLVAGLAVVVAAFAHSAAYAVAAFAEAPRAAQAYPSCRSDEIFAVMASGGASARGRTVLAPIFMGPKIAYETDFSVISSPYHRNVAGIEVGFILTWNDPDDPQIRELAASRKVEYVFLCRSYVGYKKPLIAQSPDALIARLAHDRPPAWLTRVDLPRGLAEGAILYRWNGER